MSYFQKLRQLLDRETKRHLLWLVVFSIFSNEGHLGHRTALTDTILKGDDLRINSAKFG
jgi:hypothetical protein